MELNNEIIEKINKSIIIKNEVKNLILQNWHKLSDFQKTNIIEMINESDDLNKKLIKNKK
ncbi:hypothetical protein [Candidatus Vampirococcus lugosii]|uniref:Uncharacterized protein n=1 Tax=Candidatus Vampirococcus lugosii TaxID=2789015 RepID=A0ABS5QK50_9BACT|nr:hypothetical protein [Candidatus Vampirococcus lugosii]MBS8121578.1 hypothetical protein [Candidatus Vampirococcus lugosii]